MVDNLKEILASLPLEVAMIIEALRAKVAILENDKRLLQQENVILLRNQDIVMLSHKELYEENLVLKKGATVKSPGQKEQGCVEPATKPKKTKTKKK